MDHAIFGISEEVRAPRRALTPHPDSFPIEPAFVFTFEISLDTEMVEHATILSDGQIVPEDIEPDECFDGPEYRYSLSSPRLHPGLQENIVKCPDPVDLVQGMQKLCEDLCA